MATLVADGRLVVETGLEGNEIVDTLGHDSRVGCESVGGCGDTTIHLIHRSAI
jgi:hypothetical protein